MTKKQTTLYVDVEIHEAVEQISRESHAREDLPDLSKSEVWRRLIDEGLESCDDLADLVPESQQILMRREKHIGTDGRLDSLRTGFEKRVKDHMTTRFEGGIRPEAVEIFAEGLKEDARILWPDDEERRQEAIQYVERLEEEMLETMEERDHDPLDPETVFSRFSSDEDKGDADTQEIRNRLIEIGRDASGRLETPQEGLEKLTSREVGLRVSKEMDTNQETVREVFDAITQSETVASDL